MSANLKKEAVDTATQWVAVVRVPGDRINIEYKGDGSTVGDYVDLGAGEAAKINNAFVDADSTVEPGAMIVVTKRAANG